MESDREEIWPAENDLPESVNASRTSVITTNDIQIKQKLNAKSIGIIGLLFVINLINYMDRFTIAGKSYLILYALIKKCTLKTPPVFTHNF